MARHAISVDLEDAYQILFDPHADLTERFERNVEKILGVLAAHDVRATFFVLGMAAEKAPQVIKAIAAAGHEMQSHGYGHQAVFDLTKDQFRQDLIRAKGLVEDMTGQEVFGYRAPDFLHRRADAVGLRRAGRDWPPLRLVDLPDQDATIRRRWLSARAGNRAHCRASSICIPPNSTRTS